jgi:predicted regulator of Ras-like GTPase activity (Roadblock/LC7/MglB family)
MDPILLALTELPGVTAAMVFDVHGQLVGHRGHAIYDRSLCEQVSTMLVKAIDSIQLQQPDWETITTQFADGKLLLRNLGSPGGQPHFLAVIADPAMNPSYATVAVRVAVGKLKRALDGGAVSSPTQQSRPASSLSQPARSPLPSVPPSVSGQTPPISTYSAPPAMTSNPRTTDPGMTHPSPPSLQAIEAGAKPGLSASGLSWSRAGNTGSQVTVADPASSHFLTRCSKELARHVGPMATVYLKEAVRRISPNVPFSMELARQLVDELARQIEDAADRGKFKDSLKNL